MTRLVHLATSEPIEEKPGASRASVDPWLIKLLRQIASLDFHDRAGLMRQGRSTHRSRILLTCLMPAPRHLISIKPVAIAILIHRNLAKIIEQCEWDWVRAHGIGRIPLMATRPLPHRQPEPRVAYRHTFVCPALESNGSDVGHTWLISHA